MKIKAIVSVVAILGAFILDYVPIEVAITVYSLVGATLGVVFIKVNRWAREGLACVVGGIVISVMLNEVLPSIIEDALPQLTGLEAFIVKSIPFVLKAGLIWGAIMGLVKKLDRVSW